MRRNTKNDNERKYNVKDPVNYREKLKLKWTC